MFVSGGHGIRFLSLLPAIAYYLTLLPHSRMKDGDIALAVAVIALMTIPANLMAVLSPRSFFM